MKSRKIIWSVVLLVGAAGLYAGWLGYNARRNLVTLDVRNMEVREVVKKIEWQTWEDILVDKNVQGKVTLQVHKMPLGEVLRRVGDQVSARSSLIYALYSNGKSLTALEQSLRGEIDPMTHGWTNLPNRVGGPGGRPGFGMGGFGMPGFGPQGQPGQAGGQRQLVSLNLLAKDVPFATLAFSRFAQARVVPEDGVTATVSLTLQQATVPKAVSQLAKAVKRKWTKVYVLQMGFGPGGPGGPGGSQFAQRDPNGPRRPGLGGSEMTDEKREEMRKQREALETELKQALPIEERQKLELAQQEREKQMQEMQSMPPEQLRDRMMQMMGGATMNRMNQERVLNSTPEQRAQMNRTRGGPGGGPGGPGGPPR